MTGSNTWLLAGLALAAVVAGLSVRLGALLVLALPLAVFWWVGVFAVLGQSTPRATATRTLSQTRIPQGGRVTVTVDVVYHGPRVDQLLIQDEVPRGLSVVEGKTTCVAAGVPGRHYQLCYQVEAPRGRYAWKPLTLTVQTHLSAGARRQRLDAPGQLLSLPQAEPVAFLKLRPRRTRVYAGLIPARRGGEGAELFETRPGDSIRRIHWKASARTGRWITTQFEQERMADVAVILDARFRSNAHHGALDHGDAVPLFEHAVRAALSLADAALSQSNRVGLLIYGRALEWTFPGYGKKQKERIAQALAEARLGRKMVFEGLEHLPQRLFPKRSQIVIVSPLLSQDVAPLRRLHALGYFVSVVSPNPVAFEQRLMPDVPVVRVAARLAARERRKLLSELHRAGVSVVDWRPHQPLAPHLVRLLPRRVR